MSDILNFNNPIRVGKRASAPSNPEEGVIYFDTTAGTFQFYENGQFREVSAEELAAHLVDDAVSKHDADQIDYERADGSKKNIQASSDDLESALSDIDDAIGALPSSPSNYTPSDAAIVADHLSAIDSALANAGGTAFADTDFRVQDDGDATKEIAFQASNISTSTTRTITMPDSDVDLGQISTNESDLSDHLDGSANKHDATEVDFEKNDVDKKNIQAGSDDVEAALDDLDEAIGALPSSPSNYSPSDATIVADHLSAVDTELGNKADDADVVKVDGSADFTADQSMGSNKLTNLADPTNDQDAATKAYVDSIAAGLDPKESVRAASTGNINLAAGGLLTVDGVSLSAGDRVLVKDQTTNTENGIYEAASGAWARASDMDGTPSNEVSGGNFTFVEQGTTNADTGWVLQGDGNLTIGSDAIEWTQFSGAGQITAGDGLDKSGSTLSVNTGDGIEIQTDQVAVDNTVTRADGSVDFTADQSMGSNKLTNVADGTNSADAVNKSQLDGKIGAVSEDTSPSLGGDLSVGTNVIQQGSDGVKRGDNATDFLEEEYIHSVTLAASQTGTAISELTFAHATYEGVEITYRLKESTSNDVRIGTMRVVTNGSSVSLTDVSNETADTGITFSAAISGSNVEIRYDSGSNSVNFRADVKRFLA